MKRKKKRKRRPSKRFVERVTAQRQAVKDRKQELDRALTVALLKD